MSDEWKLRIVVGVVVVVLVCAITIPFGIWMADHPGCPLVTQGNYPARCN